MTTSLPTSLPAIWPLQPGETPTPASEAAAALLELARDAQADAYPVLAQLGAAPDATPEAITLGLQLQQLLADAVEVAGEMQLLVAAS